jgi:hypothetical protein
MRALVVCFIDSANVIDNAVCGVRIALIMLCALCANSVDNAVCGVCE